jgi:hypothetical protein
MKTQLFVILFLTCILSLTASGQSDDEDFSAGLGAGLDYGGIGINLSFFPMEHVGFFGSVGYAFAGMGTSGGIQFRTNFDKSTSSYRFYFTGMYGYQSAILIWDAREHNRLFYGLSIGAGMNIMFFKNSRSFLSFGLVVPFRNPDYQNYVDNLFSKYGIETITKPSVVNTSIGYHFIF